MPIYTPGKRTRKGGRGGAVKRNVVAVLQLTAMVDMFTVLVVFLLQNYASTNQILPLAEQIDLPKASSVKELKPSLVVVLSQEYLAFNEQKISSFEEVKQSKDFEILPLLEIVKKKIEDLSQEKKPSAEEDVETASAEKDQETDPNYRVTLQVDKEIDFLSVKKVLYTLTAAGIQTVNFAVVKVKSEDKYGVSNRLKKGTSDKFASANSLP